MNFKDTNGNKEFSTNLMTYNQLLKRLFNEKLSSSQEYSKLIVPIPKVFKEGSKKTVFKNFLEITEKLNRDKEHLVCFICNELRTYASLQEGGGLAIKGRFNEKDIQKIMRIYIPDYVLCKSCNSWKTDLRKDIITRLYFMNCKTCGATRTVSIIKKNYFKMINKKKNKNI
mmetsp:Transcript_23386/g.52533  ORF Transcript_23386/g.52533 Transcript_23386/m.52533 type:complete len:171 (-) Transcript_23386:2068-2580(-)